MEVLYESCAGLDVHARTVVACLIRRGRKAIRTFGAMTEDLLALLDWLKAEQCTNVAMESTGVYWKPVFNILEGSMEVMLVNARHVKAVKGKKTDVKDCEWLADLLRHGLLKPSFIPKPPIRALRELTRYRESLVRERTAISTRVVKLAESGNIKIGQVAARALDIGTRDSRAAGSGRDGYREACGPGPGTSQEQARAAAEGGRRAPDRDAALATWPTAGPLRPSRGRAGACPAAP